jgi:hypothetical protein
MYEWDKIMELLTRGMAIGWRNERSGKGKREERGNGIKIRNGQRKERKKEGEGFSYERNHPPWNQIVLYYLLNLF